MNKFAALFNLFRQGEEVANAAAWKNRTSVLNLLVALVAVAAAFGFRLDIDADTLTALAGGVVALVGVGNSVIHLVTDRRVGLPPVSRADVQAGGAPRSEEPTPGVRDPGGA